MRSLPVPLHLAPFARRAQGARGFTLIEVLVAMLVLSLGLLGLASAQVHALGATRLSEARSVAAFLNQDMADRIRANRAGARSGHYDSLGTSSRVDRCYTADGCSPAQMAAEDKRRWLETVGFWFPDGEAALERSGQTYHISIRWPDPLRPTGSLVQSLEVQP